MGTISRRRQQKEGVSIPLLRAVAQQLPFQSHVFDSVLATFPTEYVAAAETLDAVFRVLREHGRFIIVPQARFTGESLPQKMMEWLYQITGQRPERPNGGSREGLAETRTFADQIAGLLAKSGFNTEIYITRLERSQVTVVVAKKQANEAKIFL